MLGSQLSFATVQGTVVPTVAESLATVPKGRKGRAFIPFKGVLRQLVTAAIVFYIFFKIFERA